MRSSAEARRRPSRSQFFENSVISEVMRRIISCALCLDSRRRRARTALSRTFPDLWCKLRQSRQRSRVSHGQVGAREAGGLGFDEAGAQCP